MKKKLVLSLAAAAMVGTLAVGGTLAWFTDTETATNVATMGKVDITLSEDGGTDGVIEGNELHYKEVMPGDTFQKTVTIKNIENEAYVRATITISGDDVVMKTFGDDVAANDIKLNGLSADAKWTLNQDGSYSAVVTYGTSMAKDAIWTVFESVTVPGEAWGNEYVNAEFKIKVDAEAVQKKNFKDEAAAFGIENIADLAADVDTKGDVTVQN